MDFKNDSAAMAATDALLINKINTASVTVMSNEIITGFSTPPSSSLDTCDSGFTELYSNNFTLISSTKQIIDKPDMKGISSTSDAELESSVPTTVASNDITSDNNLNKNLLIGDSIIPEEQNNKEHIDEDGYADDESDEFDDGEDGDDAGDNDASSEMSDLSDDFKLNADIAPEMQRTINWVHLQIASGVNPREYFKRMFVNASNTQIPDNISDNELWRIIATILTDPPRRPRLQHINSIEDVCSTITKSKNIIVLTGAGVSVSCGIPDFRSRNGIYERLRVEYPEMRDPQSMFDIGFFAQDPRPFFQFAREIYPGLFEPSPSHRFIKLLERHGKLLRNYTQNIDTLERVAGIENVIECHGSFATASCTVCKHKVDASLIRDDILHQRIPMCTLCNDTDDTYDEFMQRPLNYNQLVAAGIMKPDIVFFGESLPEKFHSTLELDKTKCDLLIVIGSSLKVRPVALIPSSLAPHIPQILINREKLNQFSFDVEFLGNSDEIINQLCHLLGNEWNDLCWKPKLELVSELLPQSKPLPSGSNEINDDSIDNCSKSTNTCNSPICAAAALGTDTKDAIDENSTEKTENESTDEIICSGLCRKSSLVESLADHLPSNSYFFNGKYSYIFPGAEICSTDTDDDSSSASSDSDDDDSLEKQRIDGIDGDQDDCSSIDVSSSCTSKSPSHLPETEANITLSNDQLLLQNLEADGGNDSETTDGYGLPNKKRSSMESMDITESDGHVLTQKRCKLANN